MAQMPELALPSKKNKLVLLASRGTADGLYPALILATTSAMKGMETHICFTFGGMKLLSKGVAETIEPSVDLGLSKDQLAELLSRGGMPSLSDMLKQAKES